MAYFTRNRRSHAIINESTSFEVEESDIADIMKDHNCTREEAAEHAISNGLALLNDNDTEVEEVIQVHNSEIVED